MPLPQNKVRNASTEDSPFSALRPQEQSFVLSLGPQKCPEEVCPTLGGLRPIGPGPPGHRQAPLPVPWPLRAAFLPLPSLMLSWGPLPLLF